MVPFALLRLGLAWRRDSTPAHTRLTPLRILAGVCLNPKS